MTLWTGGFDSSYRVLQRAIVEKRTVSPLYIVNRTRDSAPMEIQAMYGILRELEVSDPDAHARIEPLRFIDERAIPRDPEVTSAWEQCRLVFPIGPQYEWIARLARAADMNMLELSIHGTGRLQSLFNNHVQPVIGGDGQTRYLLVEEAPAYLRHVFERVAFPLWPSTKPEDHEDAHKRAFGWIMDRRCWFCSIPRGGHPCGACVPCRQMIEGGFADRVPLERRVRYTIRQLRIRAGVGTRLRSLFRA